MTTQDRIIARGVQVLKQQEAQQYGPISTWILSDDLDVVFARLNNIQAHDKNMIDGHAMALITMRLTASEKVIGGPYLSKNKKAELVPNLLIDLFLRSQKVILPNLQTFFRNSKLPDDASLKLLESLDRGQPEVKGISILQNKVAESVASRIRKLEQPVQGNALKAWVGIKRADKTGEIASMPVFFTRSLNKKPKHITSALCRELGVANFFCWIAYMIYDDFFDDEGKPAMLAVGNLAHRYAVRDYQQSLASYPQVARYVLNQFDRMDQANAWELEHCRFEVINKKIIIGALPDYQDRMLLANRAYAHILGPIAIAKIIGATAAQQNKITRGLEHYLIARQLNDDIHDWLEDITVGHISFVVAELLEGAGIRPGEYRLKDLVESLRLYFWKTGIYEICNIILEHVSYARSNLEDSDLLTTDNDVLRLIEYIEKSTQETLRIQSNQKDFLHTYQTNNSLKV